MTTRTRTPSTPTRQADRVVEHGGNGGDAHLLVDDLTGRARPRRPVRTLVAMPAYNEEAYIAKTVLGAARHADAVLVVDDGSTDDTVPIAEALGAMVIRHTTNKGYGGALQTIFSAARDLGAEELVIIDARHDPAEIPRLLTELRKGNDVVLPAADPESGFGAYGKRAIEAVLAGGTFDAGVLVADPGLKVAGVRSGSPAAEPRYRGKRIAVVVPAYNEEELIGEVLDGIPDYVAKVYAVDDGSADMTGAIIDDYAHRDPRIVAIHHNPNRGVGAAITTGYLQAVEDGMDIAAVMAGDNQMDPAYLPDLLDPIIDGRADYTKGNRLINQAYRKGMPPWRSFGNSLLTFLTKVASGYWQMMDPQNGYTAVSIKTLRTLPLTEVYQGYGYCNHLLIWLNICGCRVSDVAIPARYGREKSKIRYSTYIPRVSKLLLGNFLFRLKTKYIQMGFHPLAFFYAAGAVLAPIGVLGGLIALWEKFVMGYPVLFVHGVLSFLVFMMGMQFLLFAMLFDMQVEKSERGVV
ncbi:glycosyltransferase [Methanoculleus bourgensis MS2]|uniref:Glycosyltransferase n=1 Tax=Methanoculleus bourgensis (strain ATCC 43281 / DSM 3045 / OCM 15 / MS2) TaxID=1201294 RepID=I7KDN1_METBM|nr:glycosyltransferase family 2 protein [Methanoculleus bourgensis]CCJ37031.1 glycosyltransferase [Methanoculleus bourgensis MS2]